MSGVDLEELTLEDLTDPTVSVPTVSATAARMRQSFHRG